MKAPDKIYLNPLLMEDGESIVRRCTFERQRDSQIEYTRTDAFIEKAAKFFIPYIQDNSGGYDRAAVIENFKNYIKRE